MRKARLRWCLLYKDWTLENWKNVIFTDETSVVLGHRRGGYRVWRKADEAYNKSVIRPRWKGYSEFMFWGCFSYDKKGPCHIYTPETKKEREAAQKQIDTLNEELEPIQRASWELNTGVARLGLRNKPGKKPTWRWNKTNGKLVRDGKGGIDWWQYQSKVMIPKLIPFAKECAKARDDGGKVQEDGAPSHAHWYQDIVYKLHEVIRILWMGNSPDLNAIEPCWPYMKRRTTAKGPPQTRAEGIKVWQQCWKELPQSQIQAWIERIPIHIQKVIELEGGNEYKEGRLHVKRLRRPKNPAQLQETTV